MKWLLVAIAAVLVMPAAFRVFDPGSAREPSARIVETRVAFPTDAGEARGVVLANPAAAGRLPAVVIMRVDGDDAGTREIAANMAREGRVVLVVDHQSPAMSAGASAYLRSRDDVDVRRIGSERGAPAPY